MSITIDQCMDLAKLVPVLEPLLIFSVLGVVVTSVLTILGFIPSLRESKIVPIIGAVSLSVFSGLAAYFVNEYPNWQDTLIKLVGLVGA